MSFGFAIGDFIAAGELARRLWTEIYLVARAAPEELRSLSAELSVFGQSIELLIKQAGDPDSILTQAGEDRVHLVNTMISSANDTLSKLEAFAKKHQLVGNKTQSKFRRGLNKLRYTSDASTINSLRSKLVYHNGVLNLLLTSIGNSSLERMETENHRIAANVIEIKQQISSSFRVPIATGDTAHIDKDMQLEISRIFLEKVEVERPWYSFGIDVWIQAGKWWLQKAQFSLQRGSVESGIDLQAYTNLLKASWILTDIIQDHPQRTFLDKGSQQLELMAISNTIKTELERHSQTASQTPNLEEIRACDTTIWVITPIGTLNLSKMQQTTAPDCEILCERYGLYFSDETVKTECRFTLLLQKTNDRNIIYLTAKTASETDVLSYHEVCKHKFVYPRDIPRKHLDREELYGLTIDLVDSQGNFHRHSIWFNSLEDAFIFQNHVDGALHYLKWFRHGPCTPPSIHNIALLKLLGRLTIRRMGSKVDTTPFSSTDEEKLYIELFTQERKYIQPQPETPLWVTTMKLLQQYTDHGPRSHWRDLRSVRNRAGITHQWYAVQMMRLEGLRAAIALLRSEGADVPSILPEFLFAASVQKNFNLIDEILSVASAEGLELDPDDIVARFNCADLVVTCQFHKRAFWDPGLRVLFVHDARFLDQEFRNQYADLSAIQRSMEWPVFLSIPGNMGRRIPESQCYLCSRYPCHPAAEFQDGDELPVILPQFP